MTGEHSGRTVNNAVNVAPSHLYAPVIVAIILSATQCNERHDGRNQEICCGSQALLYLCPD